MIVDAVKTYIKNAPPSAKINDFIQYIDSIDPQVKYELNISRYKRIGKYVMNKRQNKN